MLIEFEGKRPQIGENVYIAPTAVLIGDVIVEDNASIWFGAVLRGDFGRIHIGRGSNVQDNVTMHVYEHGDTRLDENVTVGHGAVLEGCRVGAGSVIGMNAVVLPGSKLGCQVMVAAGAVVSEGAEIPDQVLIAGIPAKVKKPLDGSALEWVGIAAEEYIELQTRYRKQTTGSKEKA
ncbi:MAG: gamma carbonic anhydrase family protein [Gammaproteobacteria bacterium]|nr:gamma carbonic anhydrase family protein [Gammaproteobacteria bacterium]